MVSLSHQWDAVWRKVERVYALGDIVLSIQMSRDEVHAKCHLLPIQIISILVPGNYSTVVALFFLSSLSADGWQKNKAYVHDTSAAYCVCV